MTLIKTKYVIVNIWTSKSNEALPGANVGHVSLTCYDDGNESYISLWPGKSKSHKTKNTQTFFRKLENVERKMFSNFIERAPSYKQDYEQDCLFEAFAEEDCREIANIGECQPDEAPYVYNTALKVFRSIQTQPRGIKPEEILLAMKIIPANFRVVLYGLDVGKVEEEFNRLKDPEHITGWTMIGSNLLTRNLNASGKAAENCASLAYRCLSAGGLFNYIKSRQSLQLSSIVSPDDLLRIIVPAKINEREFYYGNPADWQIPELNETSIEKLVASYEAKNQHANAEEDIFPDVKPSIGGCAIL